MNEEIKAVEEVTEVAADAVETATKDIVVAAEMNNADKALAWGVLGFAGVGVAAVLGGAGFGTYKLVKHIKKKVADKKAAEAQQTEAVVEEIVEETAE